MKQRIALGSALLLTIGTAVAGSFLYGQESATRPKSEASVELLMTSGSSATEVVIPASAWKATSPPKAPI